MANGPNKMVMKLPLASQILSRPFYLLCTLALLASFFLPTHGFGVPLCGFYRATDLPCFGCGLTRSITNLTHLDLEAAWQYHPFGLFLWPFMVFFGITGVRKSWSDRLHGKIRHFDPVLTPIFWSAIFVFLAFGIWRMFVSEGWIGHQDAHAF